MNKIKSFIKLILKSLLKLLIGESYTQNIVYTLKVIFNRSLRKLFLSKQNLNMKLRVNEFSSPSHNVFFGYYDISPFGENSTLLATRVPKINRTPEINDIMEIGYYELNDNSNSFFKVAETLTWCWQQGCRLQWHDYAEGNILYNSIKDGSYVSIIKSIYTKKIVEVYKKPIYSFSKNTNLGLSLNFSRLQRLRPGYGYVNIKDNTEDSKIPENDGIWIIEMCTGKIKLLFSIFDIANYKSEDSMKGAQHYFNHIQFNPSGNRFLFFHLWQKKDKRYRRLITCDINGSDKFVLVDDGVVSHYNWKSDDELIIFSNTGINDSYTLYKDKTRVKKRIASNLISEDGHPSFSPNGEYLLTDTYPDKFGEQKLLLLNIDKNRLSQLGSFYRPLKYQGETRCDLHPRWSLDGKKICIDSTHTGDRKLYVFNTEN